MIHGLTDTVINPPVEIHLYYDAQLDIDNCGFITKAIMDTLKVKLLRGDDNKYHVVRIIQQFWSGKDIGVIVSVDSETAPAPSKGIRKRVQIVSAQSNRKQGLTTINKSKS